MKKGNVIDLAAYRKKLEKKLTEKQLMSEELKSAIQILIEHLRKRGSAREA